MKQIVLVTAEVLKQIMNGGIVYENKEEIFVLKVEERQKGQFD